MSPKITDVRNSKLVQYGSMDKGSSFIYGSILYQVTNEYSAAYRSLKALHHSVGVLANIPPDTMVEPVEIEIHISK